MGIVGGGRTEQGGGDVRVVEESGRDSNGGGQESIILVAKGVQGWAGAMGK